MIIKRRLEKPHPQTLEDDDRDEAYFKCKANFHGAFMNELKKSFIYKR